MKRRDLIKRINESAKNQGLEAVWTEGSNHTKVKVGSKTTVIPRHREIKEPLAKQIISDIDNEEG